MSDTSPILTRKHLFAAAFFAILLFLLYQGSRILAPFISVLLWSSIITLILYPLYTKVLKLFRGSATAAAFVMTALTIMIIIGPAVGVLSLLAAQGIDLYYWAQDMVQSGGLAEAWEKFKESPLGKLVLQMPLGSGDIKSSILKGLGQLSSGMAVQLGGFLKNTIILLLNLVIMVLSLFFFFRDGTSYYQTALALLPFTEAQKQTISEKLFHTFKAVINGVFLIALLQGFMTGLGFALFGIPFPVFWGFAGAVLALLPVGGAAVVWLGGAAYLFFSHETVRALMLAVWGVVFVSMPDNFLRPLIIGRKAKLPTFLLFLGILGGIQVYGILGILFGPVIVTLLMAFVTIYREEFAGK